MTHNQDCPDHGTGVADLHSQPVVESAGNGADEGNDAAPASRQTQSTTRSGEAPEKLPFDWYTHGLIVEFKGTLEEDPFLTASEATKNGSIEKDDDASSATREQLVRYIAELFNHQHRTHAFQLFMSPNAKHIPKRADHARPEIAEA